MADQNLSERTSAKTSTFTSLTDTPSSYAGKAGETLKVNVAEDAVDYQIISSFSSGGTPPTIPVVNEWQTNPAIDNVSGWGQVLLPSGKVFVIPYTTTSKTLIYNPETHSYEDTVGEPVNESFNGGVLMPNGKVFISGGQASTTKRIYNPITNDFENTPANPSPMLGATLMANGKVFCTPYYNDGSNFDYIYDPETNAYTSIGSLPSGAQFSSGVALPDGRVFCSPAQYTGTQYIYNPSNNTWENGVTVFPSNYYSYGGCLLPNGKVYIFSAGDSNRPVLWDPSTGLAESVSGVSTRSFNGGCLMKNGKAFLVSNTPTTEGIIYNPFTNGYEDCLNNYDGYSIPGAATLLPDGTVFSAASAGDRTKYIYDPGENDGTEYGTWMNEPYWNNY